MWQPDPEPLQPILGEVEKALNAGLWYAALSITLTVPDICSLLGLPPGSRSGRAKYAAWFNEHLAHEFSELTGDDCYRIRCGVTHHGHFGHRESRFTRVAFRTPSNVRVGEIVTDRCGGVPGIVYSLDLVTFCEAVCSAARGWYRANASDPNVMANVENLVRPRTSVPGHSIGVDVIA